MTWEEAKTVLDAVKEATENAVPVLLEHLEGDHTTSGEWIVAAVFDLPVGAAQYLKPTIDVIAETPTGGEVRIERQRYQPAENQPAADRLIVRAS